MIKLKDCWAKTEPFQSIPTHATVSGRVAQILYLYYLSNSERELLKAYCHCTDSEMNALLGYITSLHDIGKTEVLFQQKWEKMSAFLKEQGLAYPTGCNVRHEKTSAQIVSALWKNRNENRRAVRSFAHILGAHHQGKSGEEGTIDKPVWIKLQDELEKQMQELFQCSKLPEFKDSYNAPLEALLCTGQAFL